MELPRNAFKRALKEGRAQIGLWSSLSSNYTVEVLAAGTLFCAVGADVGILARGAEALRAKFNS